MNEIFVGLARYNEHKEQTGGVPGDQLQVGTPDPNGEVALVPLADFLKDVKTGLVYRTVNPDFSALIGEGVVKGCNNPWIGYDTNNRLSILPYGVYSGYRSQKPVECDNSSFARVVIKYGTNIDFGNFYNYNVREYFDDPYVFLQPMPLSDGLTLYIGDVIVLDGDNLIGIIGYGDPRPIPHPGEGGTTDYNDLDNKPSLNGVTLQGNTTLSELGIVTPKVDHENIIFS